MGKLESAYDVYQSDISEAHEFCDNVYNNKFKKEFDCIYVLKSRMEAHKGAAITDEELEEILTTLPLRLFTISEILNGIKLERETIQLRMKDYKHRRLIELSSGEMFDGLGRKMSTTEQREWATKCVNAEMTDHELLISAYDSLIDRIDRQISMSRELIMGAKKIWDGRRAAENANPIGAVNTPSIDLPEYKPNQTGTKTYIK